jgi:hypothetical protein
MQIGLSVKSNTPRFLKFLIFAIANDLKKCQLPDFEKKTWLSPPYFATTVKATNIFTRFHFLK